MESEVFAVAVINYVVFLFSVVCHEAAHALVALVGGDKTAYWNGQVTLSPWPHLRQEPFGLGLLPILSMFAAMQTGGYGIIGFASAPYDPLWAVRHPRRAAWVALAGPGANLLLAMLAALASKETALAAAGAVSLVWLRAWWVDHSRTDALRALAALIAVVALFFAWRTAVLGTVNTLLSCL